MLLDSPFFCLSRSVVTPYIMPHLCMLRWGRRGVRKMINCLFPQSVKVLFLRLGGDRRKQFLLKKASRELLPFPSIVCCRGVQFTFPREDARRKGSYINLERWSRCRALFGEWKAYLRKNDSIGGRVGGGWRVNCVNKLTFFSIIYVLARGARPRMLSIWWKKAERCWASTTGENSPRFAR